MQLQISTNNSTGFSAYIDQATGNAYLSDKLICKITGMHNQTLDKIIQSEGVRDFASEATQTLTEGGTQGVRGLRQASDLKLIIRAWKPTSKANIERKEKLIDAMLDAGATAYVYSMCGYSMQEVKPEPVRQLPTYSAIDYMQMAEKLDCLNNLNIKELLRDALADELSIKQGKTKALPEVKNEYTIGKVRAKELGYSLTEIGNGSGLGKWLKKSVPISFTERVGKYDVNHYLVGSELDTSIHTYFSLKATMKK